MIGPNIYSLNRKCYDNLSQYLTVAKNYQKVFLICFCSFIPEFFIAIGGLTNRENKFGKCLYILDYKLTLNFRRNRNEYNITSKIS